MALVGGRVDGTMVRRGRIALRWRRFSVSRMPCREEIIAILEREDLNEESLT